MDPIFRFQCAPLGDAVRDVLAFTSDAALAEPHVIHVYADLGATDRSTLESALGKPGTLTLPDRFFHGTVFQVELLLAVDERQIHRITLVPDLRGLALGHHSRVFVDKTVPEIIEAILQANAIAPYELKLTGSYRKRPHVCQYRESDLAFLQRWMEREGIYYFFVHSDAGATLVIVDDKSAHEDAPDAQVRYYPAQFGTTAAVCFGSWRRVHQGVTEGVVLADYDYLKPSQAISSSNEKAAVGFEKLVLFEDNLQDQAEADQLTKMRAERLAAAQIAFHGRGNAERLQPGLCFTLQEHPRDAFNQRYLVRRVTHYGTVLGEDRELERRLGLPHTEERHRVTVEAIPAALPYRPERRTPWPRVHGVESAVVDGEADSDYAQIDDEGRYRLRFLFDEAKNPSGHASAWIRMLQPHGGSPEAHHFPLRKGTEVLLAFVHGDPDRPFIVGAAPTPTTPSPVTSTNHTQNVIQTGGKNRIEIEDQDGGQYIDISSPPEKTFVHLGVHAGLGDHNVVISTTGDGLQDVVGKRDITVVGKQTEEVTGDLSEDYSSNQATHVAGAFSETIDAGKTQTISAGATQSIDGGLTQTISGGETRTVVGGVTETISGGRTQTIVGSTTETITGSLTQTVNGAVSISTPASYTLNAAAGITMSTPGSGTITGVGGVTLIAPGGQMTVDASYDWIGGQSKWQYAARVKIGTANKSATGLWIRKQLGHAAAYGVKVDTKTFDQKKWGKSKPFGALRVKPSALTATQAGQTDLKTGASAAAGGGPGASAGGSVAGGTGSAAGGAGAGGAGASVPSSAQAALDTLAKLAETMGPA